MKKVWFLSFLSLAFIGALYVGCGDGAGLGEEVDLEAPVIAVGQLESGDATLNEFAGGVYCKKDVTFSGTATDNKAVTKVYAQLKWAGEADFVDFATATLSGSAWECPLVFEKEGVAVVRFIAQDGRNNVSPKSTKTLILFVDDTAPVASAWYIDRERNGIQYSLKEKEDLELIDLDLTENKDAAQNVSFTLKANAEDTMGVGSVSIQIRDEEKNLICKIENAASSQYAPEFKVTAEDLVRDHPELATGKHYLQVWYDAEDVVTVPEPNKAADVAIEGGWFIWWQESDEPRITPTGLHEDGTLSLHISEVLSLSVFDDDELDVTYCALLTENEAAAAFASVDWTAIAQNPQSIIDAVAEGDRSLRTTVYTAKQGERDTTVVLKAADSPQTMQLFAIAWDKTDAKKVTYKQVAVRVIDESAPILLITDPKNNDTPAVTMADNNTKALVTITGQTLDSVGCTYLEFVWIPDSVQAQNTATTKTAKAKAWLDAITTDEQHEALKTAGTATQDGLRLWAVALANQSQNGDFIQHTFSFTIDLFNDFGDEKANDKSFVAKLTRKDGNATYSEYRLMADSLLPTIKSITPSGDMQIVESTKDLVLEFKGVKKSGLGMNPKLYSICRIDGASEVEIEGWYDSESDTYKATIPAGNETTEGTLVYMRAKEEKPKYRFSATDWFGNEGKDQYTLVISDLPQLTSITSTAATLCKLGDEIIINATFSNTVYVDSALADGKKPYIKLKGITNALTDTTAETIVPAYYESGSGSTTLAFKYTVQKGDTSTQLLVDNTEKAPIAANGATSLDASKVHLNMLADDKNLQAKKTIALDGIPPVAKSLELSHTTGMTNGGTTYLREGQTLTVRVTTDEVVSIQGSPSFVFAASGSTANLELPFTGYSNKAITFSKKITADDPNGALSYTLDSCISNVDVIVDTAGNALDKSALTASNINYVVDTVKPATPTITDTNGAPFTAEKYKDSVTFVVHTDTKDSTISKVEYSTDGGSTWQPYTAATTLTSSAQLTARATDYAGNVSDYADIIDLDINGTFPDFYLECTNPDGNYKAGNALTFRMTFASKVNVAANASAYFTLSGYSTGDIVGQGKNEGKATLSSKSAQNGVTSVEFAYQVQDPDQFTLKVAKAAFVLTGITDLYGNVQNGKTLAATTDYARPSIRCDGVAPKVTSMTPTGETASGSNIYTNGRQITLVFSEPIQKSTGNLTLRQVAGWAIPPVLSGEDFNTICNAISSAEKDTLSRQEENGKDMIDAQDYAKSNDDAQDMYFGTAQYVGPYKKATQGLKLSGSNYVPDTSTKYVLDFDIDIWETTQKHPIGITYDKAYLDSAGFAKQSREGRIKVVTPSTTRTAQEIREVLEKAHYHERIIDVTSSLVVLGEQDATTGGYKKATITFPAGLTDTTDDLPNGREWELVIDKGAFMDMTGNDFGAEYNGAIIPSDAVQKGGKQYDLDSSAIDTEQTNRGYEAYTDGTWGRGRKSITDDDDSAPVVLITNGSNESYWSSGVAKPVVRVDRYSYRMGAVQSDQNGNKTTPVQTDSTLPTGYVRVRIDCETKGATITYNSDGTENSRSDSNRTNYYVNTDNAEAYSYYTATSNLSSTDFSGKNLNKTYTKVFAGGNGKYKKSYKQYIIAMATKNGTSSERGVEGIFQTVVQMVNPVDSGGGSCATKGTGWTDVSIRGTTGFAGQPSISPFPLLDNHVASPYLCRLYRERTNISTSTDYYWVSYEILVDSSFSNYCGNGDAYNWAQNWGFMKPGEFTRCTGLKRW